MADMQGKTVLITGATNGIGRAAALALAKTGATVAVAGRDEGRVGRTVAMLREASGNEAVSGLLADLSTQAGVRKLAADFRRTHTRLDVLLNNAGASFRERAETVDGLERTFALNHMAYFLLTYLLLDLLQRSAPARVVNVSSEAHRRLKAFDFDNIDGSRSWGLFGFAAYSQSKLANILFTRELARRLAGTGVTAGSMHPGMVNTGIFHQAGGLPGALLRALAPLLLKTPEQGADTLVWLTTAGEVAAVNGGYFIDRRRREPSAAGRDDDAARRLWALSAELCGLPVD